jgi:hypothetical protein
VQACYQRLGNIAFEFENYYIAGLQLFLFERIEFSLGKAFLPSTNIKSGTRPLMLHTFIWKLSAR